MLTPPSNKVYVRTFSPNSHDEAYIVGASDDALLAGKRETLILEHDLREVSDAITLCVEERCASSP